MVHRCVYTALVAALLLAVVARTTAVFEDQAGTFDWYVQHVGSPSSVMFLPGRILLASTEQSLLSSLRTSDGGIEWRRRHTNRDALGSLHLLERPALALVTSGCGRLLRAWNAADGALAWEAALSTGAVQDDQAGTTTAAACTSSGSAVAAVARDASDRVTHIAVVAGTQLKVRLSLQRAGLAAVHLWLHLWLA